MLMYPYLHMLSCGRLERKKNPVGRDEEGIRFEEKGANWGLVQERESRGFREEGVMEGENSRVPHRRVLDCSTPRTPTSEPMVTAIVQAPLEVYGHLKVRFA